MHVGQHFFVGELLNISQLLFAGCLEHRGH